MNFSENNPKFKYRRSEFSISNSLFNFNIKIKGLKINPIIIIVIFTFITFIFLIWMGYNIFTSFIYTILLSLVSVCLTICLTILMEWIYNTKIEKKTINLAIKEKEKELKEMEHKGKEMELKWQDITNNHYLKEFFKILEERGILSLRELEKEVIEQSEKVIFIIESGEGTSKIFRLVFKSKDKKERGEIYFSKFMEEDFKKKVGNKVEIYRIPIPGISSFMVFCNENEVCSDINNLYNIIYKGYSDYIDVKVKEDLNKLKNDGKQKEYEVLNKWYEEYKKALNDRSRPLILITMPYRISLFTLLKIISYYSKNKDHNIPKTIEQKINQILDQKIKLRNSEIRFLYLFKAVGFDDETLAQFEELESRIVEKLKNKYKITKDNDYFYQLLHKENFIESFEESLKEVDEDFYNKIKNDSRYKDLKRLIIDIQTKIFGVSLQNISI